MTDEQIEKALRCWGGTIVKDGECKECLFHGNCEFDKIIESVLTYINRLKAESNDKERAYNEEYNLRKYLMRELKELKQLAETQLRELLSALYQQTSEEKRGDYTAHKGFTLYRQDVLDIAKDYGIEERELK